MALVDSDVQYLSGQVVDERRDLPLGCRLFSHLMISHIMRRTVMKGVNGDLRCHRFTGNHTEIVMTQRQCRDRDCDDTVAVSLPAPPPCRAGEMSTVSRTRDDSYVCRIRDDSSQAGLEK
ncbi:hypothetical protein Btru_075368 [Bulinus truncatus]|nr:hypothetical protein Btru_075368 [Bulinus truncatus]